ncbi:hypothetical protein TrST_g5776 [Triparma strigata]|uniref:MOSC domain-containing protein n=1 Tax=Triparma strigata TaxID=1606541 RepID=A0A9W7EVZ9_9STRA|nr:hypothetical protein TrST_g5776 [Triparma strigata]
MNPFKFFFKMLRRRAALPPPLPPTPPLMLPKQTQLMLIIVILLTSLLILSPSLRRRLKALRGQVQLYFLTSKPPSTDTSRKILSLHTYPLKACQGLDLQSVSLTPHGLKHDRVLMIVRSGSNLDAPKRFFTQRQCGALARIKVEEVPSTTTTTTTTTTTYKLSSSILPRSTPPLQVQYPPPPSPAPLTPVILWDDNLNVIDMGDSAAAFITNIVNHYEAPTRSSLPPKISVHGSLRLVAFAPEANCRFPNPVYFPSTALTLSGIPPQSALSDGFPILITTTASLRDLNERIAKRVGVVAPSKEPISMERIFKDKILKQNPPPPPVMTMDRFRPNIVIENDVPWGEDSWRIIRINGQIFHVVKGCPRCKQSCTDQKTGEVTEEPVETLKTFRCMSALHPDDVYFGQNVSTTGMGVVSVGDIVEVLVRDEQGEGVWDKGTIDAGV